MFKSAVKILSYSSVAFLYRVKIKNFIQSDDEGFYIQGGCTAVNNGFKIYNI